MDVQEDGGIDPGYELKRNSYDLGVDIELYDAVQRLRLEHPEVGAVILTSAKDRVFCAGANIRMLGLSSHGAKVNFCKFTNETRNGIEDATEHSDQKYICVINGTAAGGGYELALAADIRIASPDVRLAMRQVVNGAFPFDGGTQRLTRIAGPALATEMLLTGRELSADEAYSRGLISEISPDPRARAEQIARDIARHGVLASAYTKKAVLAASDMTFEEGAHLEADLSFRLHGEEEREEGLAAFREGRSPRMPPRPRRTPAGDQSSPASDDGS